MGGTAPHAFTRATEAGRLALRATVVAMVTKQTSEGLQSPRKEASRTRPVSRILDSALLARQSYLRAQEASTAHLGEQSSRCKLQNARMGFTNVLLKHHSSLALAGFLGGTAFGLYYTLQHGRAPFGLWGSSGKQHAMSRKFTQPDSPPA